MKSFRAGVSTSHVDEKKHRNQPDSILPRRTVWRGTQQADEKDRTGISAKRLPQRESVWGLPWQSDARKTSRAGMGEAGMLALYYTAHLRGLGDRSGSPLDPPGPVRTTMWTRVGGRS